MCPLPSRSWWKVACPGWREVQCWQRPRFLIPAAELSCSGQPDRWRLMELEPGFEGQQVPYPVASCFGASTDSGWPWHSDYSRLGCSDLLELSSSARPQTLRTPARSGAAGLLYACRDLLIVVCDVGS